MGMAQQRGDDTGQQGGGEAGGGAAGGGGGAAGGGGEGGGGQSCDLRYDGRKWDVYSCGMMFLHMFLGERRFRALHTTKSFRRHVAFCTLEPPEVPDGLQPPALRGLIRAMISTDVATRPHFAIVKAQLAALITEHKQAPHPRPSGDGVGSC